MGLTSRNTILNWYTHVVSASGILKHCIATPGGLNLVKVRIPAK